MTTPAKPKPYFHFPADPELHEAMRKAADQDGISMSAWLHSTVRQALDDRKATPRLLEEISAKQDRILELLRDGNG